MSFQEGAWLATIFTAVAAWWSLYNAHRKAREDAQLSLYVQLTQRIFEIDRIFIEHPEFRPFFYGGDILRREDEAFQKDGLKIKALADYMLDFFSTLQELEPKLKKGSPSWKEWDDYIESCFDTSPFLCIHFEANAKWYEKGLMDKYSPIGKRNHTRIQEQQKAL